MATEFEQYQIPQKYFSDQYTEMLKGLFPKGLIWRFGKYNLTEKLFDAVSGDVLKDAIAGFLLKDSIGQDATGHMLSRILNCFAEEFERLEAAAWGLLSQSDPGVATDLLEDWERVLGLPEECSAGLTLTEEDRQRAARAKLFDVFKTSTFQYYIDYAATLDFVITVEEIPEDTAPRIMGVARMGLERMSDRGGYSILKINVISGTGNLDLLKCSFNKIKPAHVVIVWA